MIVNLTQHTASAEQIEAGVIDMVGKDLEYLKALLTFDDLPSAAEIDRRAKEIARLAKDALYGQSGRKAMIGGRISIDTPLYGQSGRKAMIGGALWLMAPLSFYLKAAGISPVFAFSKRESVERVVDGKTVKTNVFKHVGFVEA